MPFVISPVDGASLFYTDYRPASYLPFRPNAESIAKYKGSTLFFLHGWPMSGRMFDHLMLPLSQTHGIRCIASDRRGFGKSEWSGPSYCEMTYEVFAADTLAIIKSIKDLGSFTFVCASMGCGESLLVYELMRQENLQEMVKGFVWLGPSLPYPLQTESNPSAPPQEVWDMILDGLRNDRTAFVQASIGGVFGTQHGVEMANSGLQFFSRLVDEADSLAMEQSCQILSKYDFTPKLKLFGKTKPETTKVLVLHGGKDQSMPVEASSNFIRELVPGTKLRIFENAAHGLYYTSAAEVMDEILAMVDKKPLMQA